MSWWWPSGSCSGSASRASGSGDAGPEVLPADYQRLPDDLVIITGYKATRYRKLTTGQKTANKVIAAGRAPVEHGFAHLKNWRVLTKLRTDPARATNLLRALLVLTNLEVDR